MNIAYVRVSTEEQNEERQVEALKTHGSVIFKVNPPEERSAIAELAVISSIQTGLSPGFT